MRRPLDNSPRITTTFRQKGFGSLGAHLGIDYGVPVGTPVYAPVSGLVRSLSTGASGGKMIELIGDDGRWHRFLHLNGWNVAQGAHVNEGQVIAKSGATGDVTGPHLHWDVRRANTAWNASLDNYFDPESLVGGGAPGAPAGGHVSIAIRPGEWNVRTSPNMGNNIRPDGRVLGGQKYAAELVGSWAKISFRGKEGYVGPKVFSVI